MTSLSANRPFRPDYAHPPGTSLMELLNARGLSQADLAERAGRPKKTINEIVKGKAAITHETALQFERVLGMPASYWNSLEQQYRAALARQEETERLKGQVSWLNKFPLNEMIRRKLIKSLTDKVALLQEVLSYFGVASPQTWEELWSTGKEAAVFRRQPSKEENRGILAVWLRSGELSGNEVSCLPFDATVFKSVLTEIRALTCQQVTKETGEKITSSCAKAGVAVVFVPEFPKLGVFGATRWLSADKALIQLSLHYKRADQLWFSFFHEAGHVLLHGKKEIFVDVPKGTVDRSEEEANKFASDFLIPPSAYNQFVERSDFTKSSIVEFAHNLGIAPNIVVGRLQHDRRIGFNERHDLIVKLQWVND